MCSIGLTTTAATRPTDDQVLVALAEISFKINTGLAGSHQAGLEHEVIVLADAFRPFVNVQVASDTVAGSLAALPVFGRQLVPRLGVELPALSGRGKL